MGKYSGSILRSLATTTARSMAFSSSRTFAGQVTEQEFVHGFTVDFIDIFVKIGFGNWLFAIWCL
jgi:hypothetical protein